MALYNLAERPHKKMKTKPPNHKGKGYIEIYSREINHKHPHFHITIAGEKCSIALDNFAILATSFKKETPEYKILFNWAKENKKYLIKIWENYKKELSRSGLDK